MQSFDAGIGYFVVDPFVEKVLLFTFDSYTVFVTLYKFIALNRMKTNDNEQQLQL